MVEERDATECRQETEDVDARLKAASQALIAEMEELIQRARILQLEHKAIVEERRRNKRPIARA